MILSGEQTFHFRFYIGTGHNVNSCKVSLAWFSIRLMPETWEMQVQSCMILVKTQTRDLGHSCKVSLAWFLIRLMQDQSGRSVWHDSWYDSCQRLGKFMQGQSGAWFLIRCNVCIYVWFVCVVYLMQDWPCMNVPSLCGLPWCFAISGYMYVGIIICMYYVCCMYVCMELVSIPPSGGPGQHLWRLNIDNRTRRFDHPADPTTLWSLKLRNE